MSNEQKKILSDFIEKFVILLSENGISEIFLTRESLSQYFSIMKLTLRDFNHFYNRDVILDCTKLFFSPIMITKLKDLLIKNTVYSPKQLGILEDDGLKIKLIVSDNIKLLDKEEKNLYDRIVNKFLYYYYQEKYKGSYNFEKLYLIREKMIKSYGIEFFDIDSDDKIGIINAYQNGNIVMSTFSPSDIPVIDDDCSVYKYVKK